MTADEPVNILMVDDQPGRLLSYEAMLSGLGENLIKAHSGMEALEHLLKTNIALVLMDVSMPRAGAEGEQTSRLAAASERPSWTHQFSICFHHTSRLSKAASLRRAPCTTEQDSDTHFRVLEPR